METETDTLFSTSTGKVTGTVTNAKLFATSSEYHVKSVHISNGKLADTATISCTSEYGGIKILGYTEGYNFDSDLSSFDCVGDVTYSHTGQGVAFYTVTVRPSYVPEDYIVTCSNCLTTVSVGTTTGTSTVVYAYNGMTYGDIVISFFLFLLVTGMFFGGILNRLIGVKMKKIQFRKPAKT
jgi:hypothetical protein